MRHARSLRSLVQSLTRGSRRTATQATQARRFTPRMELLEDLTLPSAITWTNPAGGNWMTPTNWSGGAVPGATDDAIIDIPGITVTHSQGTHAVRSITSRAAFVMSGGTLTVAAPSVFHSTMNFFGGTLAGSQVTVHGLMTWSGGMMQGAGPTDARGGLNFTFTGANGLDGRVLNNYGLMRWLGTNTLEMRNGGVFHNRADGMVVIQAAATIKLQHFDAQNNGLFLNDGVFRVDTAAATFPLNNYGLGVRFNNNGTVNLSGGNLIVGSGVSTGIFQVSTSRTLEFASGEAAGHVLQAAASITGAGTVVASGQLTDVAGVYAPGATRITGGNFVIRQSGTTGTLSVSGGSTNLIGNMTVNGLFTWTGGVIRAAGQFTANGGMALSGESAKIFRDGTLVNNAVATWTDAGPLVFENGAGLYNRSGGTIDARSDTYMAFSGSFSGFLNEGTFRKSAGAGMTTISGTVGNEGTIDIRTGQLALVGWSDNYGSITVAAGAGLIIDSLGFHPTSRLTGAGDVWFYGYVNFLDGVYDISGTTQIVGGLFLIGEARMGSLHNAGLLFSIGRLTLSGGYVQQAYAATYLAGGTMTAGGLIDLQGGGFAGWGTINGNVRNNGRLSIGAAGWIDRLMINGDYTQTADGILDIEIGGQVGGVDHDQLQISGHAVLDGVLNIAMVEGYSSDENDTYRVLTFGSRTGQFATINGLDLGGGYQLRPTYGAGSLDLWTIRT